MIYLEQVYQTQWIIDTVHRESEMMSSRVTDTTVFEERCTTEIAEYLAGRPTNIDNRRHIYRMIKRRVWEAFERSRREESISFTALEPEEDGEGDEELEFDPEDVLTDVARDVISKVYTKKVADLLTQADHRKKTILECWMSGNNNYAQISRLLEQMFGGNKESHRRYVTRFREECRELLSAAI